MTASEPCIYCSGVSAGMLSRPARLISVGALLRALPLCALTALGKTLPLLSE